MGRSPDLRYGKVRAVPQTYRGTRFRSTLEADWAATLDSLNIAWQYEPEAVELPSGEFYRPDFYLPQCTTWLEVKGPHDDRLHTALELGEAAAHYPACDGVWRSEDGLDLELRVYAGRDNKWDSVNTALSNAPDGDTAVKIVMFSLEDGYRFKTVATHRLRRRIQVNRPAAESLRESCYTHLPCCAYESIPWKMVVVGRAPVSGSATWESAQHLDVTIIKCSDCGQHSFFDELMTWKCRRCDAPGKVYHGGNWVSGDDPLDKHIEFVRAPRRGEVR